MPAAIDPDQFSQPERCAIRLDGDAYDLGLTVVAIDALVDDAVRASTLAAATRRHGLVVETWSAAWVHGAVPVLAVPLSLAVDLGDGNRTRSVVPLPREVRYGDDDVVVLHGVRVTTPVRTAIDLARLSDEFDGAVAAVVRALLDVGGADPVSAAVQAERGARAPNKSRGVERLLGLRIRAGQPTLTWPR